MSELQSDTPTPRTDAEEYAWCNALHDPDWVVSRAFARTLERELTAAQARIAELEKETKYQDWALDEVKAANEGWRARIAELESELTKLSDHVAVHINMLRGTIATPSRELMAHVWGDQPPAPQFLERPDAPGWWWVWDNEATPPRWRPVTVHPGYLSNRGIWSRATPPQWTPTSDEGDR